MSPTRKLNVSGPKVRKTLNSMRRPSHDDVASNDGSSFLSSELLQDISSFTHEQSAHNSTFSYTDRDDLIDSDNSDSDAYTEDEEPPEVVTREGTPCPLFADSATANRSPNLSPLSQRTYAEPSSRQYHHQSMNDGTENEPLWPDGTTKRKTPLKKLGTPGVPHKAEGIVEGKTAPNGNNCPMIMIIVAVMLLVVVFLWKSQSDRNPIKKTSNVNLETCEQFYNLESSYKNVDDTLWDLLEVSFRRANAVQRRREPGTFLFLHNGSTKLVDRFIANVTKITADCFGGTEPIVLGSKYFKRAEIEQDFGTFLAQQTDALRQQGIMVVRNLEDIPAKAAQAFHSICDPDEPLVDKAVIYFTLDTSGVAAGGTVVNDGQSATASAERLLHELWKDDLKPEVLDPLIVRLTENVYRIV